MRRGGRLCRALAFVLGLIVALLSLVPAGEAVPLTIWDKAQHVGAYAMLGVLSGIGFGPSLGVIASLTGFGAALEIAQGFTPNRTASLTDAGAYALGAAMGLGLVLLARPRWRALA